MHTDEAVHGIKFGELLEHNNYRYDPHEYHGPTLNYFTLIPAWLNSASDLEHVDEQTLRLIPVIFGLVAILLLAFLKRGLGHSALLFAALLSSISPAMVFYSRYYIQEMLLVCFTIGAIVWGYHFLTTPSRGNAIAAGLFLGLMHATKETCIITYGVFGASLAITFFRFRREQIALFRSADLRHLPWLFGFAIVISTVFFSSFFHHPQGIYDSIITYSNYFNRAGTQDVHRHPWYYYFSLLSFQRFPHRPIWSEAVILILALVGFYAALVRNSMRSDRRFTFFIALYTILITIVYCAIPYKTPWTMLSFFLGFILLAGLGAAFLLHIYQSKWRRGVLIVLLVLGFGHLLFQAILLNGRYDCDVSNPYTYSQPRRDLFSLVTAVEQAAEASGQNDSLYTQVIAPGSDYWPLPWYMRSFKRAGWYNAVDMDAPAAPLIIVSPTVEEDLTHKLYELPPPGEKNLYLPLLEVPVELRPNVEVRGYVVKELWDKMQQNRP